jgi:hypothetical protein
LGFCRAILADKQSVPMNEFSIKAGDTPCIRAIIKNKLGLVSPIPGALGIFGIMPPGGPLIQRDTVNDSSLVWFVTQAPFWFLCAVFLPQDTVAPGAYIFELRVDQPQALFQNTIRSGHFIVRPSMFQ